MTEAESIHIETRGGNSMSILATTCDRRSRGKEGDSYRLFKRKTSYKRPVEGRRGLIRARQKWLAFPIEPWRAKTHLRLSSFVPLLYENLKVLIDRSLRFLGFEQLLTGPQLQLPLLLLLLRRGSGRDRRRDLIR